MTVLECPLSSESSVRRHRRRVAKLPFFLERTFPSLTSSSSCEAVMTEKDWAGEKFVLVRLPNESFRPGESCSIHVMVCPPERKYCHPLWCAEFPNHR